ncbi:hypothetical protein [Thauera propionica]|uniref:hypothetical protein n=1 Tax=Thauera propionica TaxID=2019431 RepID=UPI0023F1E31E|nr:hypothetical protein [Thauera propionica]MDD3675816.1 hypothetical protein [Thauera propionica]
MTARATGLLVPQVPVAVVAGFAADGRVWRAFDHLVTTGPGTLALFPVGLVDGDLTRVTDGCPVPWQEVWAVLDTPCTPWDVALAPEVLARLAPKAAAHLSPYGWTRDVVPAQAAVPSMTRLVAPCGVRVALLGANHD